MNKPWPCLKCLGVIMQVIDEDHCKCPNCGTEVWHDYDEPSVEEQIEEAMLGPFCASQSNGPDFTILGGPPLPGSSSKIKGRSKKQLMKKPSTKELYDKLSGTGSPATRKTKEKH